MLASDLLSSWQWPWSSVLPNSISCVLGLKMYTTMPGINTLFFLLLFSCLVLLRWVSLYLWPRLVPNIWVWITPLPEPLHYQGLWVCILATALFVLSLCFLLKGFVLVFCLLCFWWFTAHTTPGCACGAFRKQSAKCGNCSTRGDTQGHSQSGSF